MSEFHYEVAASLQRRLEEVVFDMLNKLHKKTGLKKLTMAGGVALNCTMNSKILEQTPFEELYIQPAAWDGGTSLGSALYVWHDILDNPRVQPMEHAYWGPSYDRNQISEVLDTYVEKINESGKSITEISDVNELCKITAKHISEGAIIGWFQGRMEFGPRALGCRSILGDPRSEKMQKNLRSSNIYEVVRNLDFGGSKNKKKKRKRREKLLVKSRSRLKKTRSRKKKKSRHVSSKKKYK